MARGTNFAAESFRPIIAVLWALSCGVSGLADAASPAPAGKIDDAILKPVNEETRLRFLASKIIDLDIHLPPEKAMGFANANDVHDAAARVARGSLTKEKFLADAAKTLEKRRKEIEQVYGEKLAAAQELVKKPQNQAEVFLLLLNDVVRQLNLPADQDKPRILLGKRLQKLFDEDAARRNHMGKTTAEHDAAWVQQNQVDAARELMAALQTPQQQEVWRVWPAVFPEGPKAEEIGK